VKFWIILSANGWWRLEKPKPQ